MDEAAIIFAECIMLILTVCIALICYNLVLIPVFNLPILTFWQMLGIRMFVRMIFSNTRVGSDNES